MRTYLITAFATALTTQAAAIEFAVEANPLLYGWNLDETVQSYNLGANVRFAERWTLAATAHQFTIEPLNPEPDEIHHQHNDHFNLSLRYTLGKGFFAGPAFRYTYQKSERADRGTSTTRYGVGGIIGQEWAFGDRWYASYSLTLGYYPDYRQHEYYDNNDEPVNELAEAFGDGLLSIPGRALINAELLQVGYRF